MNPVENLRIAIQDCFQVAECHYRNSTVESLQKLESTVSERQADFEQIMTDARKWGLSNGANVETVGQAMKGAEHFFRLLFQWKEYPFPPSKKTQPRLAASPPSLLTPGAPSDPFISISQLREAVISYIDQLLAAIDPPPREVDKASQPRFMSVAELARSLAMTENKVAGRLKRLSTEEKDGMRIENTKRGKGEPLYLWRVSDVLRVLKVDDEAE